MRTRRPPTPGPRSSRARRDDRDPGAAADGVRAVAGRRRAFAVARAPAGWLLARAGGLGGRLGGLAGHGHPGDRRRRADRLPPLAQRASATASTRPARTASSSSTSSAASARCSTATVSGLRDLLSQPSFPRPVPEIGWFGVVALFTWVAYALAGLRSAVLVLVGLLAFGFLGYWADSIDLLIVTFVAVFDLRAHRDPAGHLDGPQQAGQRGDHADPGRDADDAVVRLPGAAGPGLRHRPGLGRGDHADLRAAAAGPDHRARHPQRVPDDHRGRPVDGHQPLADPAHGAAADGPADHHRRAQPVHDGRAVDGHHRGPDQRARAGPAGGAGVAEPGHRQRVRQRHRHRDHGDRAGPDHHRGQRAGRGGDPQRQRRRPAPADRADRRRGGRADRDLPVPDVAAAGRVPRPARPRRPAGRRGQRLHRLAGQRRVRVHRRDRRPGQQPAAEPAAVAARGLAVVADGPGAAGAAPTCSAAGGRPRPRWSAS